MEFGVKKALLIGKMDLTEPGNVSKLQPKLKHYCINISLTRSQPFRRSSGASKLSFKESLLIHLFGLSTQATSTNT